MIYFLLYLCVYTVSTNVLDAGVIRQAGKMNIGNMFQLTQSRIVVGKIRFFVSPQDKGFGQWNIVVKQESFNDRP